jgi:hypothetical protein
VAVDAPAELNEVPAARELKARGCLRLRGLIACTQQQGQREGELHERPQQPSYELGIVASPRAS